MRVSRRLFTDRPVNPSPPPGFFSCRDNRVFKSAVAYTRTLPEAVVGRVREVGDAVSARDWERAEELTSGNRLGWEEVDDFMTTYGWPPFTPLPDESAPLGAGTGVVVLDVLLGQGGPPRSARGPGPENLSGPRASRVRPARRGRDPGLAPARRRKAERKNKLV